VVLLGACGDFSEQRANHEKIREGIKQQEIKRVTSDQILAAAYKKGAAILEPLQAEPSMNSAYWEGPGKNRIDSVNQANQSYLVSWVPLQKINGSQYSETQRQILDAYLYSFEQGQALAENVQTLDENTFWYTKPYLLEENLQGFWAITLYKRDLIMEL
jgi:hypothetical protein